MAKLNNKHQPNFSLFPINNNRTGWQPVNLPLILVVPHVRSSKGIPISNSEIYDLTFSIEDVPNKSPVAAPDNVGLFVPNFERFKITITNSQLASVRIDPTGRRFFTEDGTEIDFESVNDGDLMEYTLLRGPIGAFNDGAPGATDKIPYYSHADYYDLSPFIIETDDLPEGKYNFVYQTRYYLRLVGANDEFVCIDNSQKILARFSFYINHPGDIHDAMIKNTPAFYFNGDKKSNDKTIAFYRPFADVLQDIFDEQELLKGLNHIDTIPAEYIPYLAYLIGIDMPYFSSTTDNIRRSLLKNGRKLQQLKGSKRAIRELFEIFGFIIDISNLWYSKNGDRFIAPGEKLPSDISDQEITTSIVCNSEPLINSYNTSGFGQLKIPLLFPPYDTITIDGWLVESGSDADISLQQAVDNTSNNADYFETEGCATTPQGYYLNDKLKSSISSNGIIGQSTILLDNNGEPVSDVKTGNESPLSVHGVSWDKDNGVINITFDHYINFKNKKLYVFATYNHVKINLPSELADLRSNRFDINVLLFKDGKQPSSEVFQFLLEFLFKFKAFHSLLRKIIFPVETTDVYNVIDFCIGGNQTQDPSTDAGKLQIPPPVIPIDTDLKTDCNVDTITGGYKTSDIDFRNKVINGLEEEHNSWKSLDGKYDIPSNLLPILRSATRLSFNLKDNSPCEYTKYGQDRLIDNGNHDFDHVVDDRNKLCSLNNNLSDYCYKGRVGQDVNLDRSAFLEEIFRCKPCELNGGNGDYYISPLKLHDEFSGGDNGPDLTDISYINRSYHDNGFVGVMAFGNSQIHYHDGKSVAKYEDLLNNRFLAIRRPSLEVTKDNLSIPGHRFISMANLKDDFTHPDYNLRPWDYLYDIKCPEDIGSNVIIPDLNAHKILADDGDEYLIFDNVDLIYYGNGIEADIPSMNDHSLSVIQPDDVTHSIWSSGSAGPFFMDQIGSEVKYVIDQSFDGLRYPTEALDNGAVAVYLTDKVTKMFESANLQCDCNNIVDSIVGDNLDNLIGNATGTGTNVNLTGGADFIDGYRSEFGLYTVNLDLFDFPRERLEGYGFSIYGAKTSTYGAKTSIEAMGPTLALKLPSNTVNPVQLQFKIGSTIRLQKTDREYYWHKPYRLDCGCLLFGCPTGTNITSNVAGDFEVLQNCLLSQFQLKDGSYDWNCDHIELFSTMLLDENYGVNSYIMDGTIPNMMSFDGEVGVSPLTGLHSGKYQFIDDYGIIHIGVFETSGDKLDITTQLKDPRVWGNVPTGEVKDWKVFRDGIVTTERQIIQVVDSGFMILAEGSEQVVLRFQTTFGCGDEEYKDVFAFHLNSNVVDDVDIVVTPV